MKLSQGGLERPRHAGEADEESDTTAQGRVRLQTLGTDVVVRLLEAEAVGEASLA